MTSTFPGVKAAAESRRVAFEEAARRLPGIARIRRFRQPGCGDTATAGRGGRHWPRLDVLSPGNSAARRGVSASSSSMRLLHGYSVLKRCFTGVDSYLTT